jgi:hypothetical protein
MLALTIAAMISIIERILATWMLPADPAVMR